MLGVRRAPGDVFEQRERRGARTTERVTPREPAGPVNVARSATAPPRPVNPAKPRGPSTFAKRHGSAGARSAGGFMGALPGPLTTTFAKRHGFAGARSAGGGLGGPSRAPLTTRSRSATALPGRAARGLGGPSRALLTTTRSRSATALPGRVARGLRGGPSQGPAYDNTFANRHGFAGARSAGGSWGALPGPCLRQHVSRSATGFAGARSAGGASGGPSRAPLTTTRSRSATALPGRAARGAWGALPGPRLRQHVREAPRLRRGARRGGFGGPFQGPAYDNTFAKRHGFAGARSAGGLGGPSRALLTTTRSRSATAPPGRVGAGPGGPPGPPSKTECGRPA